MKTLTRGKQFVLAFVLPGLLFVATGCQEQDDASLTEATAQFTQSTLSFPENDGQHQITLNLSIPASSDGEIVLSTSALTNSCFTTDPAIELGQVKLPVKKGQALIQFMMSPVDNNVLDGCKIIKFSIASLSNGLRKGNALDLTVSVNDDEAPVDADFELTSMNVRENNASGELINVTFPSPAPADGVLIFGLETSSKYGADFITEPATVSGKVVLQVSKGSTSASIKVYPIDNNTFTLDRNLHFQLVDATGGLQVGTQDSFQCTITDDDGNMISSIASVRAMQSGDVVTIHDTYIEGTVTSISNMSGGRIVVEDASGALQIQVQGGEALTRGDVVLLNLDHGSLHLQQGVLEVKDVATFEKLGVETLRINKYSLEDLALSGDRIESQTVQISGVIFTQANGVATFVGDRPVSDGTRSIIVRTIATADFSNEAMPTGPLNVTGIFVHIDGQNYLYPQEITDIRSGHNSIIRF